MNEVKITGAFEKGVEMKPIERGGKPLDLAMGSLTFNSKRGDKEVRMFVDVECVGQKAFELADIAPNIGVTITGELRRAAWKDKQTDQWQHRHFIYYKSHEFVEGYQGEEHAPGDAAPAHSDDDIPF